MQYDQIAISVGTSPQNSELGEHVPRPLPGDDASEAQKLQ